MPSDSPDPFAPESVDAETARLVESVEKALAQEPPFIEFEPARIRAAREEGKGVWGPVETVDAAEERSIPGPAGDLAIRVLMPDDVRGVYLHLHGGGWTLGAAHHSDVRNWAIARHCGLAVVSVNYRLAPENPYPAAPDDCEAAARWLVERAQDEFGSARLWIGGESAGAHLSLVTLLRMRDRHGFDGFRGANLVYGTYDMALTPSVRRWGERNLILSTPIIEWFRGHFAPDPACWSDPDVSPLHANLANLPPALISVGSLDPLLDDSLFLHARWRAAGSESELAVYPGGIHGFDAFPTDLGRRARRRCEEFLGIV